MSHSVFMVGLNGHGDSLVLYLLAVAGGGGIGAVIGDILFRLTGKFVVSRKVPGPILMLGRTIGAGILGFLVWLSVFPPGGTGWFPGGNGSIFSGTGGGQGENTDAVAPTKTEEKATPTETVTSARGETLRVVMLGGNRVKNDRFYVLEGEMEPRTLSDLEKAIEIRLQPGNIKTIEIVVYKDSVYQGDPAVIALEEWIRKNNLTFSVSSPPGDLP